MFIISFETFTDFAILIDSGNQKVHYKILTYKNSVYWIVQPTLWFIKNFEKQTFIFDWGVTARRGWAVWQQRCWTVQWPLSWFRWRQWKRLRLILYTDVSLGCSRDVFSLKSLTVFQRRFSGTRCSGGWGRYVFGFTCGCGTTSAFTTSYNNNHQKIPAFFNSLHHGKH